MAICVLNLSNKYLTDDSLPQLLGSAPEPSIILIEVLPPLLWDRGPFLSIGLNRNSFC